jgi:DNA-directed RNA polymerase subunit N (RpoN/RPB10)
MERAMSDTSPLDAIRREDEVGEYWSARELSVLLGYSRWQQFPSIITKAKIACEAIGHAVSDHFQDVSHMVTIGSGARRKLDDVKLSRYACYLLVQNADPDKPVVALGQTYAAGRAVRHAIEELGNTMPEDLPTPDRSVQEVERHERLRLERDAQAKRQPKSNVSPKYAGAR